MHEEEFIKAAGLAVLESAGGLIVNDNDLVLLILILLILVLLILKSGKWDLPKGRIENGTSCRETAIREVSEETSAQ